MGTSEKQSSLIVIQANIVMISTIRNDVCRTQSARYKQPSSFHTPNLSVCTRHREWLNSLERWRWMGFYAGSTEPSHSTGMSPLNLLLLASSDRLCKFLSQMCAVGWDEELVLVSGTTRAYLDLNTSNESTSRTAWGHWLRESWREMEGIDCHNSCIASKDRVMLWL